MLPKVSRTLALAALLVLISAPSIAVDGVIEINQAKAEAGGVTATDDLGFPVTIDTAGSYVLTSDLFSTSVDVYLIEILAESVTLDLNGFALKGENRCSITTGSGSSCTVTGPGGGIEILARFVTVRNGTILGRPGQGVLSGWESGVFEDLTVAHSGAGGMLANGTVRRCRLTYNGSSGVEVSGVILDSIAERNGVIGIHLTRGIASRVSASLNVGVGIQVSDGSTLEGCSSAFNGADGPTPEPGIYVRPGGLVRGCSSYSNGGVGLAGHSSEPAAFGDNILTGNNNGGDQVSGTLIQLGENVCGSTLCP